MKKKEHEDGNFSFENGSGKIDYPFVALPQSVFELRLNPYQFSLFAWIWRRSHNGRQNCFEGHDAICQGTGIGRTKFYEVLNSLEEKGLISRRVRITKKGKDTVITVNDKAVWMASFGCSQEAKGEGGSSATRTGVVRHADNGSSATWTTPPPAPNNININKNNFIKRSIEEDPRIGPPEGSLTPPSGATQGALVSEIEIKPIKACGEIVEGNRIAKEANVPSCVSNESIEASVQILKHPFLVRDWIAHHNSVYPYLKGQQDWNEWDRCIGRILKHLKFSEEELADMLMFIKRDAFWKNKACSVPALIEARKGKNRKIDNVYAAYIERSTEGPSKSELAQEDRANKQYMAAKLEKVMEIANARQRQKAQRDA